MRKKNVRTRYENSKKFSNQRRHFLNFFRLSYNYQREKVQLALQDNNFSNGFANLEAIWKCNEKFAKRDLVSVNRFLLLI